MIVTANASDLADILNLLVACELPTADLSPAQMESFLVLRRAKALLGMVGVQIYGQVGLLRSLAVRVGQRGRGWGSQLVRQAEGYAHQQGVNELYLLTTSAEGFFARLGYHAIKRDQAPRPIQESAEFQSLCPASAALMRKALPQIRP